MSSGVPFIVLAVYVLARLIQTLLLTKDKEAYQNNLTSAPIPLPEEKRLEYLVNNKKIPCAFERYYYVILGMPLPVIRIDRDVVERHYEYKANDTGISTATRQDIEAANIFFNDRINYVSHLN